MSRVLWGTLAVILYCGIGYGQQPDNVSPDSCQVQTSRSQTQEINDLMLFWVNAVHKYGGVHFVLMLQGAHDERQVTFLKNLVDGVLTFKTVEGYGQSEGEVEIQKLRRVLPKSKTFRHVVQTDGLVVETTARIG